MTLRWLFNPVDAVEAETDWPDDLCARFVSSQAPISERILLFGFFVSFAALGVFWLSVQAGWLDGTAAARWANIALAFGVLAIPVPWALLMVVARIVSGWRTRRMLPRFLEAPWCLKCRYPIGAIADECVRCPECGYGIRWQIAELAEERAKRYTDSA